ncbi:MAG: hypothetical protein MJY97_01195 [Bacteroidales bacterium]|nr:hypothetical protein [Bacteroidales bacterium]
MGKIGYTTILEWMYALNLKLPQTVCLAVIFGFSQDNNSTFRGSRKYLAQKMCAKDTKTVDSALSVLIHEGLIERVENNRNGILLPEYRVTHRCLLLAKSMGHGKNVQIMDITDTGVEKKEITINKNTKLSECNSETESDTPVITL